MDFMSSNSSITHDENTKEISIETVGLDMWVNTRINEPTFPLNNVAHKRRTNKPKFTLKGRVLRRSLGLRISKAAVRSTVNSYQQFHLEIAEQPLPKSLIIF